MTVPGHIARELKRRGVPAAFGVPGGEGSSGLIQALRRNGIRFVLCHTESQAAFAAAAMAEITGQVGVVVTSLGPGAASVINGAAHALLDRVPLLVITDRFAQAAGPVCGHQFIDQAALFAPVTKGYRRLTRSGVTAAVRDAIDAALEHPRGPVHIDFPVDLADAEVTGEGAAAAVPPAHETERSRANLGELPHVLRGAQRPVILFGLEANADGNRAVVAPLLRCLRAPALTTYKAIGVSSGSAEWSGGVFTGGALEEAFLAKADLILTIGFDAVEMIPTEWRWSAPVLRLAASPAACPVSKPVMEARGPLSQLMASVADALSDRDGASLWTEEEVRDLRDQNHSRVLASWPQGGINPTIAVQKLASAFPSAIFSVDAGAHMFAATLALSHAGAYRCSISNGLATMGYALPAAIGAAVAEPNRPAVAITGDGGLSMCQAEIETAVRSKHRIVIFLLNDAQLSLIKIKQEAKGHVPRGISYGHIDWVAIASAYQARSYRAVSGTELEAALLEAARHPNGVDLIEVVLAPDGYAGLMETVRGRKGSLESPATAPQAVRPGDPNASKPRYSGWTRIGPTSRA